MDTNQNNIHINSFTKGMNTDTSLDMVSNEQYVFGQNIRITTNTMLGVMQSANTKEGVVVPIPVGDDIITEGDTEVFGSTILAVASIGNIGAVIVRQDDDFWSIYRVELTDEQKLKFTKIFTSDVEVEVGVKQFSVVINKETDKIIKLYIADGVHELMQINIHLDCDTYNQNLTSCEQLISNYYFPQNKVQIIKKISGRLKTSQIQYTYRLYRKHGVRSKLAPLTSKIQVIDDGRDKEIGNAEDSVTSIGFKLQVPLKDSDLLIFDRIQIYRLSYVKQNTDSIIELIYDNDILPIVNNDEQYVKINDNGIDTLQQLSIDEFVSLDTLNNVPKCIEQNQNYLFEGNVEDETQLKMRDFDFDSRAYQYTLSDKIILYREDDTSYSSTPKVFYSPDDITEKDRQYTLNKYSDCNITHDMFDVQNITMFDKDGYVGGTGKNVSWRFITTDVPIFKNSTNSTIPEFDSSDTTPRQLYYLKGSTDKYLIMPGIIPQYKLGIKLEQEEIPNTTTNTVLLNNGIRDNIRVNYNDRFTSSLFRSLKRDETYRYGIVLYDKFGRHSDVQWIGDIKTPEDKLFHITNKSDYTPISEDIDYTGYGESDTSDFPEQIHKDENLSVSFASDIKLGPYPVTVDNIDDLQVNTIYNESSYFNLVVYYPSGASGNIMTGVVDNTPHQSQAGTSFKRYSANISIQKEIIDKQLYITISSINMQLQSKGELNTPNVHCIYNLDVTFNINIRQGDNTEYVCARPIGIEFKLHNIVDKDISGYQIVMCEKSLDYTKNIMQVATSRPVRQQIYSSTTSQKRYSPYYPSFILTSNYQDIQLSTTTDVEDFFMKGLVGNVDNEDLFQVFSPEIQIAQNDSVQVLQSSVLQLTPAYYAYGPNYKEVNDLVSKGFEALDVYYSRLLVIRDLFNGSNIGNHNDDKQSLSYVFNINNYYDDCVHNDYSPVSIQNVSNTLSAGWNDGVTNVQLGGSDKTGPVSGILAYKSFSTSIGNREFNNWVSNGMYNLRATTSQTNEGLTDKNSAVLLKDADKRSLQTSGYIGPGPASLLIKTESKINNLFLNDTSLLPIAICNITHEASQFSGYTETERQYDTYYGFGCYRNIVNGNDKCYTFNGDVYITPMEVVSMYKTYNFNSGDTIPSAQFIYYIPIESKINTFFDYGMNYRNTQSKNLQLEPGEITGVATQDRPQYQYNMIYSDNNKSNDVFFAQSLEDTVDTYSQRIFYSELKTAGENIDRWADFKPLNYIDADTRHGAITNLLTAKDILYFWQEKAFGKLSVNERSLVTDNNSNTIQLGQGGVLQRTDYISTQYGMRPQDFSAINIDGQIFWIDIMNNAIVTSNGQAVTNYGEAMNVQNIINERLSQDTPKINYDVQNNELLCKCLDGGNQLVFNIKLNVASSVYTRDYQSMIQFDNTLYGLWSKKKYNNIAGDNGTLDSTISFTVNVNSSTTKVFDDQEMVVINPKKDFLNNKTFEFETNICENATLSIDGYTDREGNIKFSIPRENNAEYGGRIRGKWMKETINDNSETTYALSHILTKFRQSFS